MVTDADELRTLINGEPERETRPRPREGGRRRRFVSARAVLRAAGVFTVLAGTGIGVLLLSGGNAESGRQAGDSEPEQVAVVSIDTRAMRSEAPVARAVAPVAPSQLPGSRLAAATPEAGPSAPPVPVPGQRSEAGLATADLVAKTNAAWSERFGREGIGYEPVRLAALEDWSAGRCASNRPEAEAAAYCVMDTALHAPDEVSRDTRALLGLAHEIGEHLLAQTGILLSPARGDAQFLRADCFAGLWARSQPEADDWIYPERLARVLNPAGDDPWAAMRVDSFRQGYLGDGPMSCEIVPGMER